MVAARKKAYGIEKAPIYNLPCVFGERQWRYLYILHNENERSMKRNALARQLAASLILPACLFSLHSSHLISHEEGLPITMSHENEKMKIRKLRKLARRKYCWKAEKAKASMSLWKRRAGKGKAESISSCYMHIIRKCHVSAVNLTALWKWRQKERKRKALEEKRKLSQMLISSLEKAWPSLSLCLISLSRRIYLCEKWILSLVVWRRRVTPPLCLLSKCLSESL